ncbi:MAG: hypothetical protein WDM90_20845 [Ferruginibacter sp.]
MKRFLLLSLLFATTNLFAQDAIEYQTPPKEIYDLVMAKPTPGVSFDSKRAIYTGTRPQQYAFGGRPCPA